MGKIRYWAIRATTVKENPRIERAYNPREALQLAYAPVFKRDGAPLSAVWEAKDLGTSVRVIQSDRKRIALLTDPAGWELIT